MQCGAVPNGCGAVQCIVYAVRCGCGAEHCGAVRLRCSKHAPRRPLVHSVPMVVTPLTGGSRSSDWRGPVLASAKGTEQTCKLAGSGGIPPELIYLHSHTWYFRLFCHFSQAFRGKGSMAPLPSPLGTSCDATGLIVSRGGLRPLRAPGQNQLSWPFGPFSN